MSGFLFASTNAPKFRSRQKNLRNFNERAAEWRQMGNCTNNGNGDALKSSAYFRSHTDNLCHELWGFCTFWLTAKTVKDHLTFKQIKLFPHAAIKCCPSSGLTCSLLHKLCAYFSNYYFPLLSSVKSWYYVLKVLKTQCKNAFGKLQIPNVN